jgi:hypothetical protein
VLVEDRFCLFCSCVLFVLVSKAVGVSQSQAAVCGLRHGDAGQQTAAREGRATLPCDEQCAKEARKKQLAQAFGRQHQNWSDAQTLLGLAKTHPLLLRRVETNLSALVARNAAFVFEPGAIVPNLVFPAMGAAQRKVTKKKEICLFLKLFAACASSCRIVWAQVRVLWRGRAALGVGVAEERQQGGLFVVRYFVCLF